MRPTPILADRRHTTRRQQPDDVPLAHMSAGQTQALLEAYCEMMGSSQDAYDARAGKRAPHLVPLRLARRAQFLGVPKAKVVTMYRALLAQVEASYPEDDVRETLLDAELDAEACASRLTCDLLRIGRSPSEADRLTIARDARAVDRAMAVLERFAVRVKQQFALPGDAPSLVRERAD